MQDFTPLFPRSISGGKFRLPLTCIAVENIGKRADRAYRELHLTEAERVSLIKVYDGLMTVDRSVAARASILKTCGGRKELDLSADISRWPRSSQIQPAEPWRGSGALGEIFDHNVGYLERVQAFIEALERKYAPIPAVPVSSEDDI